MQEAQIGQHYAENTYGTKANFLAVNTSLRVMVQS